MKTKAIQVFPRNEETYKKIENFAEQLRTSKAGFVGLALDLFIPAFERGEVEVVNGQIVFKKQKPKAA